MRHTKILVLGFVRGLFQLLLPSTWRWMKEAKDEYSHMTWFDTIGIVLFNDYRREKSFERDWD